MTPELVLAQLEALAQRLGVAVRVEPFPGELLQGRGGLCRVGGRPTVLMDASMSKAARIRTLAGALSAFDVESVFLYPVVRAHIEAARGSRQAFPA